MKKLLLFGCFTLLSLVGSAQVIFYVEAPSPNEGNYDFTWADAASGWATPDMTLPANAITANVAWVTDGVDSLSCNPLTNDLTGNIAVLYRGSCEFGTKALNAQNAGAIGVIIINVAGEPIPMGGGADGGSVTIPVVMISATAGNLLKAEFEAGTTSVFIGTKSGLYADDIGFTQSDHLRAESFGVIGGLNIDASEFDVTIGSWVYNYGTNDQTDITLNCTIIEGGSTIYDETSAPQTILAGDSMFIPLPLFSQTSYPNGLYEMDYTASMGAADEASFDNAQEADFFFSDSLYSLSRINPTTYKPVQTIPQFNGTTSLQESCLHFRDPNASRVFFKGATFAGNSSQFPDPTSLDGNFFEIYVYEWNDVFTDFNDYPDLTIADLNEIAYGSYIYTSDAQGVPVYVPFEDNPVLVDDQRYLVCVQYDPNIYAGYDNKVDYTRNFEADLQPYNVVHNDAAGNYFFIGFGSDQSPTLTINMQDTAFLSIVEQPVIELDAYPNPTMDILNIPLNGYTGDVQMTIMDLTGKMIETQNVGMVGNTLQVDVTSIPAGTYVIDLDFENGDEATVRVAVIH